MLHGARKQVSRLLSIIASVQLVVDFDAVIGQVSTL
jgi:hypothetical protein